MDAYEGLLGLHAFGPGKFSVGDQVSIADICLVVQVWRARSLGVDLHGLTRVRAIEKQFETLRGVRDDHWDSYDGGS